MKGGKNDFMQEREFTSLCLVAGWITGIVGFLIVFSGGLIGYIFSRHRIDNHSEHCEMKTDISDLKHNLIVLMTQHDDKICEKKR